MRLVVDTLGARKGGTAYAAARLAQALAAHEGVEHVAVVTREGSIVAREIEAGEVLHAELLPRASRLELASRLGWEAVALRRLVRRRRASHLLSWSGMLPRSVGVPVLCHVSNPMMFEAPGRLDGVRRLAMARAARLGARFATPTATMGRLVEGLLGETPTIIPYGVDAGVFFPAEQLGVEIICVSDFYRHKRHDLLLKAWSQLDEPRPPLRLIGDFTVDPDQHHLIADQASRLRSRGQIVFQSGLDVSGVGAGYRRAGVFVLPSEHESFSLPLLEAQACGIATVVRDLPALRETGGPSTLFVSGDRTDAWTTAMKRALSGADDQVRTSAVGHAATFTWPHTAAVTYETLIATR